MKNKGAGGTQGGSMVSSWIRTWVFIGLIGSLGAVLGGVSSSLAGPQEAAIADVKADPWRFHEKKIRVKGIVGECLAGHVCRICSTLEDHTTNPNDALCTYLGIFEFGHYPLPKGKPLIEIRDRVMWRQLGFGSRFFETAEVSVEGVVDANCSGVPEPNPREKKATNGLDDLVVCFGQPPIFYLKKVVELHRWIPMSLWPIGDQDMQLKPANKDDSASFRLLFDTVNLATDTAEQRKHRRLYTAIPNDQFKEHSPEVDRYGAVCVCEGRCEPIDWPRAWSHTRDIISNPYVCRHAKRVNGKWQVMVDFDWR